MGPVSKHWGQLRLLNCIPSPFVIGTASHLLSVSGAAHLGRITSHHMASYVVALRIAPTQLVALLDLWCIIITISHGARIKRIVSLICRVSSMSHHITSHLIACHSAARHTTAVCRAARCMSHHITSRVSEPLWGSATRCCAPVLGRANPWGGCGVYPCRGNWDERTLYGGAGVYPCGGN